MTQVIGDEDRNRQSTLVGSEHGGLSGFGDQGSDTTATHIHEQEDHLSGMPTTDQEAKRQAPAPPPLRPPYEKLAQKNPKATDHLAITIGPPMIILFDIVIPCIIYYVWYDIHRSRWEDACRTYSNRGATCPLVKPEYDDKILGYAVVSFGFGEVYILFARVRRLLLQRDQCAPLLSRSKWELDATSCE